MFGRTPEYRVHLVTQIKEIVYQGNGGYNWETVYNMPIWLRKFTFKKIQEYFDKQNEEIEKQKQSMHNAQKIKNEVVHLFQL